MCLEPLLEPQIGLPSPIAPALAQIASAASSAAVGALASGLTPISIFSNLLNAYATLDNKHDIKGYLSNKKHLSFHIGMLVFQFGFFATTSKY